MLVVVDQKNKRKKNVIISISYGEDFVHEIGFSSLLTLLMQHAG